MNTLIELYDERPIENLLGALVFKPKRLVFLCPTENIKSGFTKKNIERFFEYYNQPIEVVFEETSLYKADKVAKRLEQIIEKCSDCAIDITGGTDASLFAAGVVSAKNNIPVFTYSRRKNNFYDISNASFAEEYACDITLKAEDFFVMAGGAMKKGRVDNKEIKQYLFYFARFFSLYIENRRDWIDFVSYMQKISQVIKGDNIPLNVKGDYQIRGEKGKSLFANEKLLRGFESLGFIEDLNIIKNKEVSFKFKNHQIRYWLRDIGSVLELYVYKAVLDTNLCDDVISSAVVDWEGTNERENVINEIDVVATRGITPIFISCKTCEISTEALNELAVLRDRFGGNMAKAIIVTSEKCNAILRHRASELNIDVIDIETIEQGNLKSQIIDILEDVNGQGQKGTN